MNDCDQCRKHDYCNCCHKNQNCIFGHDYQKELCEGFEASDIVNAINEARREGSRSSPYKPLKGVEERRLR